MGTMSDYMSPELTGRINDAYDRLSQRIMRAEEAKRRGLERIDRDEAEREAVRREEKLELMTKADESYSRWGERPPQPRSDGSPYRYWRRILKDQMRHLPPGNPFSSLRLQQLPKDPNALDAIAPRIEQAFAASFNDPATVPIGTLREIRGETASGHKTSHFVGRRSFIADMTDGQVKRMVGGVEALRRNAELFWLETMTTHVLTSADNNSVIETTPGAIVSLRLTTAPTTYEASEFSPDLRQYIRGATALVDPGPARVALPSFASVDCRSRRGVLGRWGKPRAAKA
jgi:hypothetical protein